MPDQQQAQAEPRICLHCKAPLTGFFEVVQHKADGATSKPVRVCSILCLLQYAYNFMLRQGAVGVARLQALFANLRGPQGPQSQQGPQGPQGQQP
jgi:hypothetical protein